MKKLGILLAFWASSLPAQWQQTSGPEGVVVLSAGFGADGLVFVSQGGDFYKQEGSAWQKFSSLPSGGAVQVIGDTYFAMRNQFLFRSGDQGQNWEPLMLTGKVTSNGTKFYNITNDTLYTSVDKGLTWQAVDTVGFFTQTVVPHKHYLIANSVGFMSELRRSTNDGVSWVSIASPVPPGQFNTFIVDLITEGGNLYALLSNGEIHLSTDDGNSWTKHVDPPTTDQITYSRLIKGGNVFWIESAYGIYVWSGTWGLVMDASATLVQATEKEAIVQTYEGIFRIFSDKDMIEILTKGFKNTATYALTEVGQAVYASSHNGLYRSTNRGDSWQQVGSIKPYYITKDETTVYAQASEGLHKSTDDGMTWVTLPTPRDETWQDATSIASDGQTVYVSYGKTFGEHGQTNWVSGGVLKSEDHGTTWKNINNGLPANVETHVPVNQVVFHDGALYVATLEGIFRSNNKGAMWSPMNTGIVFQQFKSGLFLTGGNALYFNYYNDYYKLSGDIWTKLPKIDTVLTTLGAYGGYSTGLGDSLFVAAYKYDDSDGSFDYSTFVHDGNAWKDISSSFPKDVVLNCFIRTGGIFMAGSMQNSVWRSGATQSVKPVYKQAEMMVYPNPSTDKLYLTTGESSSSTIAIYDMLGRSIMRVKASGSESVDVSSLLPGTYIIEISYSNKAFSTNFTKH